VTHVGLLLSGPSSNWEFTSSCDLLTSLNSEIPTSEHSGTRHQSPPHCTKRSGFFDEVISDVPYLPSASTSNHLRCTARMTVGLSFVRVEARTLCIRVASTEDDSSNNVLTTQP